MDAKVNWQGRMTFKGTSDSGFNLTMGATPAVGGDNDGFRPMELFAIGLAGCTAMDVISIMQKKRQDVTDFEIQVHIDRSEKHPKVFTDAVLEYCFYGHDLDETAAVRSIELSATRYCPAQAMLGQIMPIDMKYQIFEDRGDGEHTLVKSGDIVLPEK